MYRNHYERMQKRLTSTRGKRMKKLRSSTVEPVFGSLLNYFGLRRCNARGQSAAHKRMLLAATAYNLKKWVVKKDWPKAVTQVLALHPENLFVSFNLGLWKRSGLCNSHSGYLRQAPTEFGIYSPRSSNITNKRNVYEAFSADFITLESSLALGPEQRLQD